MTGATGFLGGEIVRQAIAAGVATRALTRRFGLLPEGVEAAVGDVRNPESLGSAMGEMSWVIHAAGLAHGREEGAGSVEATNVGGTENVVRAAAAAGACRVVLVSSVSVYGGSAGRVLDEDSPSHPDAAYAASKHAAELVATELSKLVGVDLLILRLATLYGEGDPGNLARLIHAIDGGRFVLPGSGKNRKSLLHREDAARACLDAARACSATGIYNVVGSVARIEEVVEIIARRLGRRALRAPVPEGVISAVSRLNAFDRVRALFRDDAYDGSRFEATFGFRPRVPLEEGLEREIEWYRRRRP